MMMKTSVVGRVSVSRRNSVAVRATNEPTPTPPSTPVVPSAAPVSAPTPAPASAPIPSVKAPKAWSVGDAMAFAGPAPETINGRLAMLGFVAAIGAEISSQESVLVQFSDATPAILATFAVFAIASLIPLLKGTKGEAFGPFSPQAELLNGRAAMIGFAALLAVEAVSGKAFL